MGRLRATGCEPVIVPGAEAVGAGSERSSDERFFTRLEEAPVQRVVDDVDDGEVGFVGSRVADGLRLVVGMVRAKGR
jgi:hypothetical protein